MVHYDSMKHRAPYFVSGITLPAPVSMHIATAHHSNYREYMDRYTAAKRRIYRTRLHFWHTITLSDNRKFSDSERTARLRLERPLRERLDLSRFDPYPQHGAYDLIYWCYPDAYCAERGSDIFPLCGDCVNDPSIDHIAVEVESGDLYDESLPCDHCGKELSAYYDPEND